MKNKVRLIIYKYLSNRFSPETEERVQKWIIKDENTEEKTQASEEYWDKLIAEADSDTYLALDRCNQRIGHNQKTAIKVPLYKKIGRIAAVLIPLFICIGGYLYYSSTKINMIEISVAYGEQQHLFLPDSSEIWLNAGTTLKYPEKFDKNHRTVHLQGEAYFSVTRNETSPFVVETDQLSVKVLGTKFNVKAYSGDEKTITTLTSGKVEVKAENNDSHILKPSEQLTFNRNTSAISIVNIPTNETNSWITGQLTFNNASLDEILQVLERHFNVSITNKTQIPSSKLYTIKFLKDEGLEEILDILQEVIGFTYQKEGDKIIIGNR